MNKITHLIPMEDFIDKCLIDFDFAHYKDEKEVLKVIYQYRKFIAPTPELWMFVPCDEDGKVLQVPQPVEGDDGNWNYQARFSQYHTAKQRCLFERFEVDEFSGLIKLEMGDLHLCCNKDTPNKIVIIGTQNMPAPILRTISDLTKFNLKLSQNAINKIYQ